ncbi:hypothetical protein [Shimia gijangensis]|uniref:hypothetical protein n=1 Tax=Shimia gijangensis TaxID=1470563 RepID=UPI0011147DA5|nr:hypothetical protein [Shimia gijangensis]
MPDKATVARFVFGFYDRLMKNLIRKSAFALSLGFSAAMSFAYYDFYFKWRSCFNELGRCIDSKTGIVYLEQSGVVWLSLALLATCATLYQFKRLIR